MGPASGRWRRRRGSIRCRGSIHRARPEHRTEASAQRAPASGGRPHTRTGRVCGSRVRLTLAGRECCSGRTLTASHDTDHEALRQRAELLRATPRGDDVLKPGPRSGIPGCTHPWHTEIMRTAFAHDAVLRMASGADIRTPGGALTVALCGHWDHQAPCPIAPHHTRAVRGVDRVHSRILFATEPELEPLVRQLISRALDRGQLKGPDGRLSSWQVLSSTPGIVTPHEGDHAQRLVSS